MTDGLASVLLTLPGRVQVTTKIWASVLTICSEAPQDLDGLWFGEFRDDILLIQNMLLIGAAWQGIAENGELNAAAQSLIARERALGRSCLGWCSLRLGHTSGATHTYTNGGDKRANAVHKHVIPGIPKLVLTVREELLHEAVSRVVDGGISSTFGCSLVRSARAGNISGGMGSLQCTADWFYGCEFTTFAPIIRSVSGTGNPNPDADGDSDPQQRPASASTNGEKMAGAKLNGVPVQVSRVAAELSKSLRPLHCAAKAMHESTESAIKQLPQATLARDGCLSSGCKRRREEALARYVHKQKVATLEKEL